MRQTDVRFPAPSDDNAGQFSVVREYSRTPKWPAASCSMNALLLTTALKTIPNPQMLVNVVRLRVKQLALGHRPLVMSVPGTGLTDVALAEIIDQKLSFELTPEISANADDSAAPAAVLPFPTTPSAKVKKAA